MTGCVLDASSVLAWCFDDEGGAASDALIDRVAAGGAAVPAQWPLAIAKGLVAGERRRRISPAKSATFIAMLEELPIVPDPASGSRALHETTSLAREHRLSACDAAYLELAMRLGRPLATAAARSPPPQPAPASRCSAAHDGPSARTPSRHRAWR